MYAPVYPQDELKALYPGVHLLHGSIRMGPGMRMNRNMIVLDNGGELILINPVRMTDEGLARLDAMGKVKAVLRLGDFHGLDDQFYVDRYQCEFWAQEGQTTYQQPSPDRVISAATPSPFPNSQFFIFEDAAHPEAALLLNEHHLLITTDSVQYHADWSYFSPFTKFAFKLLGFKTGVNIGPPWLKRVTKKGCSLKADFERLLLLDFDAMVGAHGMHMRSGAKDALIAEVRKIFG